MNDLIVFAKKDASEKKKKDLQEMIEKMNLDKRANGGGYVYLVIDCSGSMKDMDGRKLEQAKRGAIDFANDAKKKGYFVGLIQFHSYPTHLCDPADTSDLEKRINNLELGGDTHMAKAIDLAHQNLKNRDGHCAMAIATDGYPNGTGDPEASLEAGERAKKDGIDIMTIGTDDADRDFLAKLASKTELSAKVDWPYFGSAIALMAKKLPERRIAANEKKYLEH